MSSQWNRNQSVTRANAATLKQWHQRLCHISADTIKLMKKNNVVDDLDIIPKLKNKCEDCSLNKFTRAHHPSRSTVKAKKAGNILHLNTAGPSNIESFGKSRYLLLCKCEASKYRMAAFVKQKSQICDKVKEFISKTTLETGNSVLKLCTDNGTE